MSKTPKSSFSLQNFNFRYKFFFDQNLDFVLGFAKFTSIWESANFAFDVVIVVVFWLLIFPGDNENVPGGLQGMDLGMKVLDHAILPGLFFTEYMISRVPIDSRGFYWYAYAAVGVGYIVTNMVVTTIMNVPVYSILPWFTAGSTGIGKSFAYGAGCIAIGIFLKNILNK